MTTLTTYRRTETGWTYNIVDLRTGECLAFDGGFVSQPIAVTMARYKRDEVLRDHLRGRT